MSDRELTIIGFEAIMALFGLLFMIALWRVHTKEYTGAEYPEPLDDVEELYWRADKELEKDE